MGQSQPLYSFTFGPFKQVLQFYRQIDGIQTHNLRKKSPLPWPLDPGPDVINKLWNSRATILWNNALWLFKNSHVSCNNQSECFISPQGKYTTLKFVYDIGSSALPTLYHFYLINFNTVLTFPFCWLVSRSNQLKLLIHSRRNLALHID